MDMSEQEGAGRASGGLSAPSQPLGRILLAQGKVGEGQLDEALTLQRQRSERIGELLCSLGHVDERSVCEALVS